MRWLFILIGICWGLTLAQDEAVVLELGFDAQIVNEHWNPLRLTTRDMPDATLSITMMQGSLREGDIPVRYEAAIPGRTGVSVFEDDIFVPTWRSFSWVLRTSTRVLASGSLERRQTGAEPHKPLNLIVSARPSNWLDTWPRDTRVVTAAATDLPERLAAYDGVASILLDGSAPAPSVAAVAAAAGGANVVLLDPLPDSHRDLAQLAGSSAAGLGTGNVLLSSERSLRSALLAPTLQQSDLQASLFSENLLQTPNYVATTPLLIAASVYAVLCLLLLRFGGAAGLLTGLAVAVLGSLIAWSWLRPESASAQVQRARSLSIGAGGLSERLEVRALLTLPGGDLELPIRAAPDSRLTYVQTVDSLSLVAPRWQSLRFYLKPQLETARLSWQNGALYNDGDTPLSDVYVFGLGPQDALDAGTSLVPTEREQRELPEVYNRVLSQLPPGSALARDAGKLYAALPNARDNSTRDDTTRDGGAADAP